MNSERNLQITRVLPFKNGNPTKNYYKFENLPPFTDTKLESVLAQEIVSRCPYIIYFEDFQDLIPDKIYTAKQSKGFNIVWYEIIDGLFYNTNENFSIKKYREYFAKSNPRYDDARTVLTQVNRTLQETFTKKWKDLSGVRDIEEAEITFQEKDKSFEIKITEKDGTTFSVFERSKGAIWYLAFLMKTEFRRKKLRQGSGKPIYLIDEPASNLHSTAQTKMVGDFLKLVEDTSLIYTTHSRYLISQRNIKNTFVVSRENGVVNCKKWSAFIDGKGANVTYYQPLFDFLNIVPTNFDIPWKKALVTEGPSDALIIEMMLKILDYKIDMAIYPGTSASNLSTLISLNLGWGAEFKVLLDSDNEGVESKEKYINQFGLDDSYFLMLPSSKNKIEKMFKEIERTNLYQLATSETINKVSKKQFLSMARILHSTVADNKESILERLSQETINSFDVLLKSFATK